MKRTNTLAMIGVLMLGFVAMAVPALAIEGQGTREEAQAVCEKAVKLIQSDGIEKAVAKFQDKEGGFIDRDLYVFVLDQAGTFVAHGAKPVLVGKGGLDMKDPTGFPLIRAFLDVKDKGWVDYKWPHFIDKASVKDKSSYIVKVDTYTVGVGYYKN